MFASEDLSDAGLLAVCGSLRNAADQIAQHIARHNAKHEHPLTQCTAGTLIVAEILGQVGGSCTVNSANLLELAMEAMGFQEGNSLD